MSKKLLTIILCLIAFSSYSQNQKKLQILNQNINTAKNDAAKIEALLLLSDYYSIFKLDSVADEVVQKALSLAEISNDKELVLKILFGNYVNNISLWNNKQSYIKYSRFINKGLEYAQDLNRDDYVALAYVKLASVKRKLQLYDEAMEQVTHAFTALGNSEADSIKCVLYNELGDIYIAKGDAVPAYKNYNNAFFIAYKIKNTSLQSEIYHHFFELYWLLREKDLAKKNLQLSLELNEKNNYKEGMFKDYIDLSRITDDSEYIKKAAILAQDLNSERYKLDTKRRMFYWYMVNGKNSKVTLNYLHQNHDVEQSLRNQGASVYFLQTGWVFQYSNQPDSALYYYKLAEAELTKNYQDVIISGVYTALAQSYSNIKNWDQAKKYYEKALNVTMEKQDFKSISAISDSLSAIYKKYSNYEMAYYYDKIADSCKSLIQEFAAKDKVMLLKVDRENKKIENDVLEARQLKDRKHYLQIMAITIAIIAIFVFMLFLGLFAVSKSTIRMLSYLAFISLFEFIVMLMDPAIIHITNDEPLKKWGIKIFVIALLVPFQHFLEHGLITFLQSPKILKVRQSLSKRQLPVKSAASASKIDSIEADAALL